MSDPLLVNICNAQVPSTAAIENEPFFVAAQKKKHNSPPAIYFQLLYVLRLLEELDKNTLVLDDGLPLPSSTTFISIPGLKVG